MAYDGVVEDFAACVRGQRPGRIPVFALGLEFDLAVTGVTCAESRLDVDKTVRCIAESVERFGYDWAVVFPDDYVEFEPLGLVMRNDPDTPAIPARYLTMDADTLRGFRTPDARTDMRLPIHLEMIRKVKERLGDTVCVVGRIAAPFSTLALVYGMDVFLTNLVLDPALVHDNLRFFVDHQIAFGNAQFAAGADLLWLGDCVAASKFISVDHFEEFAFGPAAEVASALADARHHIVYHASEDSLDHLALHAQLPVSALNLGEGVRIGAVRERIGDGMCLMGNFDPILLRDGSPERIARATERMIEEGRCAGGYVFNTAEGVTPDTPPENVLAMMAAARSREEP